MGIHFDLDLYEGTRDAIDFIWPRMMEGAIAVFDDYGRWQCPGIKKAVDEAAEKFGFEVKVTLPFQSYAVKQTSQ